MFFHGRVNANNDIIPCGTHENMYLYRGRYFLCFFNLLRGTCVRGCVRTYIVSFLGMFAFVTHDYKKEK